MAWAQQDARKECALHPCDVIECNTARMRARTDMDPAAFYAELSWRAGGKLQALTDGYSQSPLTHCSTARRCSSGYSGGARAALVAEFEAGERAELRCWLGVESPRRGTGTLLPREGAAARKRWLAP